MADGAYEGMAMGKKIMMRKSRWLEFYDLHLVGFRFDGIVQDPWFLGSDDDDDDDGFYHGLLHTVCNINAIYIHLYITTVCLIYP